MSVSFRLMSSCQARWTHSRCWRTCAQSLAGSCCCCACCWRCCCFWRTAEKTAPALVRAQEAPPGTWSCRPGRTTRRPNPGSIGPYQKTMKPTVASRYPNAQVRKERRNNWTTTWLRPVALPLTHPPPHLFPTYRQWGTFCWYTYLHEISQPIWMKPDTVLRVWLDFLSPFPVNNGRETV